MSHPPQPGPDIGCPDCDGAGYVADTDASVTGKLGSLIPCVCAEYVPAQAGTSFPASARSAPLSVPLSYIDGWGGVTAPGRQLAVAEPEPELEIGL